MTYQSQTQAYVAYKVQSGLGTQASGSGGTVLRTTGGAGGKMTKAATESNEVRRDGMRTRGRHGTQGTTGEWGGELSIGSHEAIMEAVMRGTWGSANLAITEATSGAASEITTTASTIVGNTGSWITVGLRVGDVIRLTGHSTAGNNSRNLRITGLTATVITVAETLTENAVADTAYTITRPGRVLINPATGSLVKRYFTIDEYMVEIDQSEVMTDFVWGSMRFSMQTDGIIMCDPGGIGTGKIEALATGSSPLLTSPSEATNAPLSVVDATIRLGSSDLVDLTSFDIGMDISLNAPKVFGSGQQKYSPDVFSGQMGITLNLTALRKDLVYLGNYIDEDVLSLHVLAVENETAPEDFVSLYVPNFTLGDVARSALSKEGGPMTETLSVPVALVGKDNTGGAFDPTMIKIQSTYAP